MEQDHSTNGLESPPHSEISPGEAASRCVQKIVVKVKSRHIDIHLQPLAGELLSLDAAASESTSESTSDSSYGESSARDLLALRIQDCQMLDTSFNAMREEGVTATILPAPVEASVPEPFIHTLIQVLIDHYADEEPVAAGWLRQARLMNAPDPYASSTGPIVNVLLHNQTEQQLVERKGALRWIEAQALAKFGISLSMSASVDHDALDKHEEVRQLLLESERREVQNLVTEMDNAPKREPVQAQERTFGGGERPFRRRNQGDDEKVVPFTIGRAIDDEITPIREIVDEMRRVAVEGRIFSTEIRTLPSGRTLIQFNMTDLTDSITAKMFVNNEKQLEALSGLTDGIHLRVQGQVQFDTFLKEIVLMIQDMRPAEAAVRMDDAPQKRVELHAHTQMSSLDGVASVADLFKQAAKWGHTALAITDHGVVQSFPEAYSVAKKNGVKCLLGMEAYVVDDGWTIVHQLENQDPIIDAETEWVVFDVETTGLNPRESTLIEIAAVKMRGRDIIAEWSELIDPLVPIPKKIIEITHITDEMVRGKRTLPDVLAEFRAFVGNAILVAHNAEFDLSFLKACAERIGMPRWSNVVVDTLGLARMLYPRERNYRLGTLAKKFDVALVDAHRALDDTVALAKVFQHFLKDLESRSIHLVRSLNEQEGEINYNQVRPFHVTLLVQNKTGLKNLYKIVSESHVKYLYRVPRVPRSLLTKYREGLLVGSACQNNEVFDALLRGKSAEEVQEIAQFYDYLEIQPPAHYEGLVNDDMVASMDSIHTYHRTILDVANALDKPVVATGDVHYVQPEDAIYREVFLQAQNDGKGGQQPPMHLMTTTEMLNAFAHLGEDVAWEIVVRNPNRIAESIEDVSPVPDKLYTPRIEGADDEIRNMCYARAKALYGTPLPEIVEKRLEKELHSITTHGFSVIYLISHKIVKKSLDDGYLVGSRGSVGSSFVATMSEITEVNPLPPHYRCSACQYSEFIADGSVGSGFDLPDKDCPTCGHVLDKDGHDIPFETFLGFEGDKVPDIDLNFSGDYQAQAHAYTKVLFGEDYVYRAGTIATVAEKTAYGYVKKFAEEKGWTLRNAEMNRLVQGCTGIKRTTGQHPGGILVIPDYMEVYDFTPIQFPADDKNAEWRTSHFDFQSIHDNVLKLDILGHDDPTVIRMLQDLTGLDPKRIPTDDAQVLSLFSSTKALTVDPSNPVTPEKIRSTTGTYGIPEFGTKFVRQMLEATKPNSFSELLQISGLSHGTDVWLNNAQKLIQDGTCVLKDVIGCRDDIMVYLIYAGLEPSFAFKIMESVRRGRGLTPEMEEEMKLKKVPDWYIWSCKQIKYMFPKAHATAYVLMAVRIAYFKVHYPLEFYATYFSVRASDFDLDTMIRGNDAIVARLIDIESKGIQASPKEKALQTVFEMALEMTARGFKFLPLNLYTSDATRFTTVHEEKGLLPPFAALDGVGESAARGIAEAAKQGAFLSIEDLQDRSRASKTVIELLQAQGCLEGMPESNQLSLF